MNYSIYRISLDMQKTNSQAMLGVKQGDSARKILITLTDGGRPYQILEGCTARLRAKTSNGNILFNYCTIYNNVIEYTLTDETCKNVGIVDCEVTLYGTDSQKITSASFSLIVERTVVSDGEIEATNEFTALTKALNEVNTLDASVSKVGDTATISVTKKDGTVETATVKDGANGKDGKDANPNLFANAIKGTASGKTIRVDDVSPVEHSISCKLTSETITDFSSVKMRRYGKNLYDSTELTSNKTYNGVFVTDVNSKWFGQVNIDTLPDVFTVSTTIICDNPGTDHTTDTSLRLYFYDKNKVELTKVQTGNRVTTSGTKAIIVFDKSQVPEGTQYVGLMIRINSAGYTENTQIEQGATVTTYESYVEYTEYTAEADGTVEGITSLSPTMTLLTDTEDAYMSAEYVIDTKTYIDKYVKNTSGVHSSVTLLASAWQGSSNLYSQVVSINGVTANSKVDLNPSVEQLQIFYNKDITFVTENDDGVVTVYCVGQKPTNDYTMQVTITEVIVNG